ncbi:MAG: murein biosynthesis integral membrane protein MurJ [Gemmatimonadaceae bacterium]
MTAAERPRDEGGAGPAGKGDVAATPAAPARRTGSAAALIAAGILLSRLLGLVRQRVFGHYFGVASDPADAFNAAVRIPNFLQNLFGEGVLSASFIPVYSRLLGEGKEEEAGRVAGAVLAILALVVSVLVLVGVLTTPLLIDLIAAGFEGEKRQLAITLVRIMFPGIGMLVLGAWCLGILNSHHRFFLSYVSPVVANLAMIATLLIFGRRAGESRLAVWLAWGSVVGSLLTVLVQLPSVLRLVKHLRVRLDTASEHVRTVLRNFGPVFVGRGVVQISGYVDAWIASFLGTGAVTGLAFAQTIYMLPVSLFGMAVSAAELPAMSRLAGDEQEVHRFLRGRLDAGLRRIAFFIVPSAVAFLALGDVVTALLFQSGKFGRGSSVYVWGILAGSAVGLLASTLGRLYSSTYYALRDTRTPLRFAIVRVILTTALGLLFAFPLRRMLGLDEAWGVAGLTASAGIAGWVEFYLLRRALNRRIGKTGLVPSYTIRLYAAAAAAAAASWGVKLLVGMGRPLLDAPLIVGTFGALYLGLTAALVPETRALAAGLLARLGLRRRS